MSIIEGGATFRCGIHGYETTSIDDWNEHCDSPDHTEQGWTRCVMCGTDIEFSELPFHRLAPDGSKNIQLRCEECDEKMLGTVKRHTPHKTATPHPQPHAEHHAKGGHHT